MKRGWQSMSLGEKDAVHLAAMLRYLNLASSFIGEMTFDEFSDESHVQTQFAVAMAIAQVGEHVKGLSREFRSDESSVDWREIAGTRDWLVHKYDEVDLRILYGSVVNDTPALVELLESLLEEDSVDFGPVAMLDDITTPLPPEEN